jgi:hypothetical protein
MKITKEHFGKKITWVTWNQNDGVKWFVPHAFCFKNPNRMYGFDSEGKVNTFLNDELWDPFEEPPKKVIKRMAPALIKTEFNAYYITTDLFESEQHMKNTIGNGIKFPASENMWVEIEVEE